jgi:hypothetical protein
MTTLNGASPIGSNNFVDQNLRQNSIETFGYDRFNTSPAASINGVEPGVSGIMTRLQRLQSQQSPLETLANTPSKLETLAATPSQPQLLAGVQGQTQITQGRVDVRVQAPVQNAFGVVDQSRFIEISVMPLSGSNLGTLNTSNQAQLEQLRNNASTRINNDNLAFHGKTTAQLRQQSREDGYFNSPSHQAWAKAAEARSAGQIPASWWIQNDPYGGTAGNGPLIEPTGVYPGVASKIAMGHDTDWTLGRHFGAGPLRDLATMGNGTSKQEFQDRGMFGLWPTGTDNRFSAAPATSYSTGHADWNVRYTNPW